MNLIYEKLFDYYGAEILKKVENYDEPALNDLLSAIPLDKTARLKLEDAFFDRYLQWSTDAFAVGLHLGLSLLHRDVRRTGPQQVQ